MSWLQRFGKRRLRLSHNEQLRLVPGCRISQVIFGCHVRIEDRATFASSAIGDHSYVGPDSLTVQATIGEFCSRAFGVLIGARGHLVRAFMSTHPPLNLARADIGWSSADNDYSTEFAPTAIANDVLIEARSILRDGVRVGDGVIVVQNNAPHSIPGCVPSVLIRMRFCDDDIATLPRIEWLNRDDGWMRADLLQSKDIALLREAAAELALEAVR